MFGIGPTEIVLVLVIALLVFGPKRLPELGRQIGKAMGEVRKVTSDLGGTLGTDLDPAGTKSVDPAVTVAAAPAPAAEYVPAVEDHAYADEMVAPAAVTIAPAASDDVSTDPLPASTDGPAGPLLSVAAPADPGWSPVGSPGDPS